MEMNNLNDSVLCYKYTTSKLFYDRFMMNVIGKFLSVTIKIYKTVAVTIILLSRTLSRTKSDKFSSLYTV